MSRTSPEPGIRARSSDSRRTAAAVRRCAGILVRTGRTLSVCESCTGGMLSSWLTARAGSSRYFAGGIVAYADDIKVRVADVRPATLRRWGAVSRPTARELAINVRTIFKTDLGLAVTGIAGPAGGTARKPVGTVHVALAGPRRIAVRSFRFAGSRTAVRRHSVRAALGLLRDCLEQGGWIG